MQQQINEQQALADKAKADGEVAVMQTKATAEANEITTKGNAEAIVVQGEAEAKAIAARGEAYKQNPQLIELEMAEISAATEKAWADKRSGFSFEGMSGFNFANLTEILKGIIPTGTKQVNDINTDINTHDVIY